MLKRQDSGWDGGIITTPLKMDGESVICAVAWLGQDGEAAQEYEGDASYLQVKEIALFRNGSSLRATIFPAPGGWPLIYQRRKLKNIRLKSIDNL